MAVVFAVPQFLDRAIIGEIIQQLGITKPAGGYNALLLLGIQLGIMLVLALTALLVIRAISVWRQKG